jgi:hypothetical protein
LIEYCQRHYFALINRISGPGLEKKKSACWYAKEFAVLLVKVIEEEDQVKNGSYTDSFFVNLPILQIHAT